MALMGKLKILTRPCHCFRFMALLLKFLDVWTCRQQTALTVLKWTHCSVVGRWSIPGSVLLEVHILLHLLVLIQLGIAWTLTAVDLGTVLTLYGSLCSFFQMDVALWLVQLLALVLDRTIEWMMPKILTCLSDSLKQDSFQWSPPFLAVASFSTHHGYHIATLHVLNELPLAALWLW